MKTTITPRLRLQLRSSEDAGCISSKRLRTTFLTPRDSTEPVEFNTLALRTVWQPNLNTIICHVDINHMRDGCLGHQGDQLLLDLDLEGPGSS